MLSREACEVRHDASVVPCLNRPRPPQHETPFPPWQTSGSVCAVDRARNRQGGETLVGEKGWGSGVGGRAGCGEEGGGVGEGMR